MGSWLMMMMPPVAVEATSACADDAVDDEAIEEADDASCPSDAGAEIQKNAMERTAAASDVRRRRGVMGESVGKVEGVEKVSKMKNAE